MCDLGKFKQMIRVETLDGEDTKSTSSPLCDPLPISLTTLQDSSGQSSALGTSPLLEPTPLHPEALLKKGIG